MKERFDGQHWNEMFELLVSNAGIGLGALWAGDVDLAVMAETPYLALADHTTSGVNWPVRPSPPRSHHLAHGTLGIVYALAVIGEAAGRDDLINLALAGAADVTNRRRTGPTSSNGAASAGATVRRATRRCSSFLGGSPETRSGPTSVTGAGARSSC